jgi:hypothetical protein
MAGSWLIASVYMVRTMAMSSTTVAMCGSSSLIQAPLPPCWLKEKIDGAIGKLFCPEVMPVRRWPLRTDSGRSLPRCFTSSGL